MPQCDDLAKLSDLGEKAGIRGPLLRPTREKHRGWRVVDDTRNQSLPEVLREKRHHGGDHAQPLDEPEPERPKSRLVAVPEPTPRAPDVPVREVVDVGLEGARHIDGEPPFVACLRLLDEQGRSLDEPTIEWLQLTIGTTAFEVGVARHERLDRAVVGEELGRVPQRQQPPLDLLCRAEAKEEIAVGRLCAVLPAHHVGTHPRKRFGGADHVAPGAVHLLSVLVEHLLVAEDLTERRTARERHRHEELRVEPETDLLAHLGDPVGREPLLPGLVGRQVRRREALRGASAVALGDEFRVLPAEGRKRHDPSVEPDVADLLDPLYRLAARFAADRHGIDPGTAQLLELIEPFDGSCLELGA